MKANILGGAETKVSVQFKTQIRDIATGRTVKESPWQKNLVLDIGLNGLAQDTSQTLRCTPSSFGAKCLIGDGTNANSFASGAITFTQSGTTITASAGFFTSAMVGAIFKYGTGTGGAEYYITAFTDSTHVTVDTSATVGTPTIATVWMVQQTVLQNLLFTTTTYENNQNGTTFSTNTVTHKRTFVFAHQNSSYNVNEIGWNNGASNNKLCGRAVLGSTDTVAPTQFYVVVLQVTFTYTPASPTAVPDVGTGINVAGNAALEWFATGRIGSDGSVASGEQTLDGTSANSGTGNTQLATTTYTQNSGPATSNTLAFATAIDLGTASFNYVAASRGVMQWQVAANISTNGETAFGVAVCSSTLHPAFDVKLTTPFVLPVGAFVPTVTFQSTYDRTLTN